MDDLTELRQLLEEARIADCVKRFARAADRLDKQLFLSAFHPDAVFHHHGQAESPRDFVAAYFPEQAKRVVGQHYITNVTVEITDDVARAETYYLSVDQHDRAAATKLQGGRYLDRLEKLDGEWRITERRLIREWAMVSEGPPIPDESSRRDASDPSYALFQPSRG